MAEVNAGGDVPTNMTIYINNLNEKIKPEDWLIITYYMRPDNIGSLLHHCSKIKALRCGLSLHASAFKTGLESDLVVSNHVLNMYAKCAEMGFARQVFDEMPHRNLISWSAMISGYDQVGDSATAIHMFSRLEYLPNEYVFASAISACASLKKLVVGRQIHGQAVKLGCDSLSFVANSLISMYMKSGSCGDALKVCEDGLELNSVAFNMLISGFVENKQPESGFRVFNLMLQKGLVPDHFSFAGALGASISSHNLRKGIALHCQIIKRRFDSSAFIGNVLMTMYSNYGMLEEVERVFRSIEEKDVISWNTLIAVCCRCCDYARGLNVFKEMTNECGIKPDNFTFASVLTACTGLASSHYGKQIHAHLITTRTHQDAGLGNALVNMYAKCGCIDYAYDTFRRMVHRDVVSWNTIIAGFGNHGLVGRALELFNQMKSAGLKPDSVTFTGVLTACNHVGLVEEGLLFFKSMEEQYGISPELEHVTCLIDLLGRAGRLREAEEYMNKYPFGHDPVVLGSLLSACRLHGDVVTGERLARELVKLRPVTTSPYVLLANLRASDEMWDNVAEARKLLKGSGLKKEPGCSCVEEKRRTREVVSSNHQLLKKPKSMVQAR